MLRNARDWSPSPPSFFCSCAIFQVSKSFLGSTTYVLKEEGKVFKKIGTRVTNDKGGRGRVSFTKNNHKDFSLWFIKSYLHYYHH